MSCKKIFLKSSGIQGKGLYAGESIKTGEIVMMWMYKADVITETEYNQRQENNDDLIKTTGVRYIGDYFLHTSFRPRCENYINHSFSPNLLYHCGICFALTDIDEGEELTVDYSYLLSESDNMGFVDEKTGQRVKGLPASVALTESCKKLIKITQTRDAERTDVKLYTPYL